MAKRAWIALLACAASVATTTAGPVVIPPDPEAPVRQKSCWFRFEPTAHEKREFARKLVESDGSETSRVALHKVFMEYCGGDGVMLTCIGLSPDLKECLPYLH